MTDIAAATPVASLTDPNFLRKVNALRTIDPFANGLYLLREYAFLAVVAAAAVWLAEAIFAGQLNWAWAVPGLVVANLCVGAGQHRLATLTHEAAHYMLFKNRLLNDFVSDWFCMFPLLGTTHSYRVQHLGHHQYPNDPEKDPDWTQLTRSGHKFRFPMSRGQFLWHCLIKQILWPPALIRYVLVRAFFKVDRDDGTPYRMIRRTSRRLLGVAVAYHAVLIAGLTWCVGQSQSAIVVLAGAWLTCALALYSFLPDEWFASYAIKPDISVRTTARMRLVFNTAVLAGLASLTCATGRPCWLYFFVLWMIPLGTSFALFMILRQLVQHGNADGERFTNTRIFRVHPLLSMSIFPIGNDDHLPHHLFPLVPHYNLKKLHKLLCEVPEYRANAMIVGGYFYSAEKPSVLDLMTH
ncbi:MAG: fatty acid desaturase [Planctomycetota bacterium]